MRSYFCRLLDMKVTECSRIMFFHNSLRNRSLVYLAVRDHQSSQRNASVQSLLFAGNFLYNQRQPSTGEGEVANFRDFFFSEKKHNI